MRILLSELYGTSDDEGLVAGLAATPRLGNPDGLTVAVRGPVPRLPLSPAVEAQLLAIGREALANVAKHSAARRAWVSIESSAGAVSLEIRDSGSGFDARVDRPGHYGLESMRTRAAEAGAADDPERARPGTIVRVVLEVMERRSTASEAVIRVLSSTTTRSSAVDCTPSSTASPISRSLPMRAGERRRSRSARASTSRGGLPTSSSWTCRCLRWTASRPRAASGTATRRWRSWP